MSPLPLTVGLRKVVRVDGGGRWRRGLESALCVGRGGSGVVDVEEFPRPDIK